MSKIYQQADAPHFEYDLQSVSGLGDDLFRGPIPDLAKPFAAFLGGAQTFGRFVHDPFPSVVARAHHLQSLNLGIGGAGPRYFLRPAVLETARRARFVVVQFCAGRSSSCSLFDNTLHGRNSGVFMGSGKWMLYEEFFAAMRERKDPELLERIVRETREDYVYAMQRLGDALDVPTVLLWISRRAPRQGRGPDGWFDSFPQLIDQDVVDAVRPHFDALVECTSEVGLPQKLWPADSPVAGTIRQRDGYLYNEYYPSPEMHALAAEQLVAACSQLAR